MTEPIAREANELANSEEMINFYRVLAAVQTNAIFRVMCGKDPEDMKQRAEEETNRLRIRMGGPGECGIGQFWDERLGRCV